MAIESATSRTFLTFVVRVGCVCTLIFCAGVLSSVAVNALRQHGPEES